MEQRKPVSKDSSTGMERTNAMTPDKMDRSTRVNTDVSGYLDMNQMPYPLTEEEATPSVPESERTLETPNE